MAEQLDPITNLPEEPKKSSFVDISKLQITGTSGQGKTQLSPMKDLLKPVDVSKSIAEKADSKFVQLAKRSDFKVDADYGKIMDKYDQNFNLQRNAYLKELDDEQNILESAAAGGLKLVGKTVSGIGFGLLGTGWAATKALFTLDSDKLLEDNIFTELEEGTREYLDENLPIYSDNPNYHNLEFFDKLFTEPGKLFGDEVGDAVAFTASAIGQEVLLSMATAATFGAAEPIQASATVRLAKRGYDIYKNLAKGKKALKAFDAAGDLAKYKNTMANFAGTTAGLATATHYEAGLEARGTKDAMLQSFKEDYISRNGVEPTEADMLIAEDLADQAMWTTYGLNAAILSSSYLIQFSSVFQKGYKGFKNLEKAASKITREGTEYMTKQSQMATWNKILQNSYLVAKNPITEATEEFLQGVASEGALEYFGRQYDPKVTKENLDFFSVYGKAATDYFNSTEGGNSMGIGAIVGLLGLKVPGMKGWQGGVIGELQQHRQTLKQAEELVASLNSKNFESALKNNFKNAVTFSSLSEEMAEHAQENDAFSFKNKEQDAMFSYMYNRVSMGLKEDVLEDIATWENKSLEEFNQEFGNELTEPFTQEQKDKTVKKAKEFVESIEKNTKAAESIIEYNIRKSSKKDKKAIEAAGEAVKPYLVHAASTLQNVDIRETELTEELANLTATSKEFIQQLKTEANYDSKLKEYLDLSYKKDLNKVEAKRKKQLGESLKIDLDVLAELKLTKKLDIEDIRNASQGTFENFKEGVTQEEFVKAAEKRVEELEKSGNTSVTVNKGQIKSAIEDIAKLKNRRETFSKFYDFLATKEGVETMSNLVQAAEEVQGKGVADDLENKAEEAAKNATNPADIEYAKNKAAEAPGTAATEKVEKVHSDKLQKQAENAPKVDTTNAGSIKRTATIRYTNNGELFKKEAKEFIAEFDPTGDKGYGNIDADMGAFIRVLQNEASGLGHLEKVREFYAKIEEEAAKKSKINNHTTKTHEGPSPETVDSEESDFESEDKGEDKFSFNKERTVINVWQYWMDKSKDLGRWIFPRTDGRLIPANPILSEKNTVNHELINSGNLKVGTKLKFFVDTSESNPTVASEEDFRNEFKILVKDEAGNVLGLVPSVKNAPSVLAFREKIFRSLENKNLIDKQFNYTDTNQVIDTGYTSTVEHVDAGRVNYAPGLSQKVTEVLGDDFKLGVGRIVEGNIILSAPGVTTQVQVRGGIKPGVVYALVPNAGGRYTAFPVNTRNLTESEQSQVEEEVNQALANNETPLKKLRALEEVKQKLDFAYIPVITAVTQSGETTNITYLESASSDETTTMSQQEFIEFLKAKKAQVDASLINTSDYNQKIATEENPRITTNIVKNAPIHSATFSITEIVKEEASPLADNAKQTTSTQGVSAASKFEAKDEEAASTIPTGSVTTKTKKNLRPAGGTNKRKVSKGLGSTTDREKLATAEGFKGGWNKEKSLAWLKKNLPNVPVHILDDLSTIHNSGGTTAWGLFKDASIYIMNNAGKGTAYHEAFHAVFWLSLNDTQRFNLLKEAQLLTGYTDDIDLEEYLAEKFEDYMISNVIDTSLSGRIKNWFKRIKATIKSIFSNQIKIDELYRNINNGVYKNTKVTGKYADLVRTKMAGYTVNERVEMGEMLADMFRDEISILEDSNRLFTPEELINKFEYTPRVINEQGETVQGDTLKGPAAIMAKIYHEQLYYNHDDLYQIVLDYKHDWNKIEQSEAYKSAVGTFKGYKKLSKEELEYRLQMYTVLMDEFEDLGYPKADSTLFKDAVKNLRNYGINIQFQKKKIKQDSNLEAQSEGTILEEKIQEEQEANNQYEKESWMYSKAEVSGKDTISQFVRSELSQLDEVTQKGNEFVPVTNIVGYPKKLSFGRVFNSLKSDLTNAYDLPTMLKILESKVDKKPYYSQVISLIETNQRFRSGFVHALATARVDYISLVEQPNGAGFNVVGSNRNTPELTIRKEWSANLLDARRRKAITPERLTSIRKLVDSSVKYISEGRPVNMDLAKLISNNIYSPVGIEITPEEILRDIATINTNLKEGINTLLTQIEKGNNPFSMNESGETKAFTPLLDLVKETRNDLYESSFLNVEGKQVFTNQTPNFLHKHTNKLTGENSAATIANLQKDVFYKDNLWLNELKKGDNKNIFKVFMIDGISFLNKEKKKYTKLTPKERMLTDLLLFHNSSGKKGKYTFPILADAPQLPVVEFLKYTQEEVINHLIGVAQQEYNRNTIIKKEQQEYKDGLIRKEDLILNYHINSKGELIEPKYHYITTMGNFDPSTDPKRAREAVEKFIANEIEAAKENIKRFSISRNAVDSAIQSTEEFNFLVEDYVHNQVLANIQMLQIFAGDSAFYKSQADLSKRNKQATNPGNVLDLTSIGETYNTMYFKDIELPSALLKSYEEILKDVPSEVKKGIINSYGEVSLTDAQAVISLERYKAIKTAAGEWTPEHEVAYPKIKEGTATSLEMSLFLQPLKPFYYGMTTNHLFNGKIVPVQNKNSEFVIFPQMLNMPYFQERPKAKANLEKMLNLFDSTEFNLDSIQFDTAVKVGGSGISNFADLNIKDVKTIKANTHTLNNRDYNIQLSVPEHHINSEILLGTQIRKLVIANIDATSTEKNYTLNGEPLTGAELIAKYQEAIVANVEEESRKLAEIFKDNKELSELLKEQMRESGMSQKYIDALELDNEGKFKYPLFLPNVTKKNESILSALFRNRVTRQKIKGGSFVQVSDFVFGEGLEVKFKEVEFKGEKKLIVEHMEALLPWWSKDYFPMDENGIVDITKIDPELLNLVGLRIPTEAKYSMPTIKVVGFTPQTAGGVAVLPADITRRMGADFDVDKLYIMMPEFDITTDESSFRKAMQNELGISFEVYDYIKNTPLKTLVQNAEGSVSGQAATYLEHRKFIDANKHRFQTIKKVPSGLETTQQRNNLLLDIMNSILKNPLHQVENITPGSFEVLMNLKKVISEQLNLPKDDLNMALPSSQVELFARNMSGSSMIGIYANHAAHHAITQYTNIEFSNPMTFVLTDSKGVSFKYDAKALNIQEDVNGKLISASLAEFLAAAVDNAKDPVLSSLNINEETADVVALLVRTGIPLEEAIYFINLPSIRYLVTTMLNGNSFEIAEQLTKEHIEDKFREDSQKDGKVKPTKSLAKYKSISELNLIHIKNTVLNYSNFNKLNEGEKTEFKQQLYNGLVAFTSLRNQAKDLATLLAASRADAKGSQGINSNQTLIDKIEKVKLSDTFVPGTVSELFDGNAYPMVRAFTNEGIKKANQTLNKFFPFNKGAYLASKVEIAGIKGKDLTEEEQDAIDLQGLTFIASQFEFFNMEREEAQKLILEFPIEFREILNNNPELKENQFIEILKFEDKADNKTNLDRIITNNASALDELQKEKIELGFMELMEKNSDFAKKLLKYSFAVNGFSFSPTSFMNFMPLEAFDTLIDSKGVSLTEFFKNNSNNFNSPDFVDKFVQNNLDIFPDIIATKEVGQLEAKELYTTYGKGSTMGDLVSFVVDKGSLPRFVKVANNEKTFTFYESMGNEDYSVYTLLPVSAKRGYYLPYTQESGVTSAYDESALTQLSLFGANGGYAKVGDIKYTGASQLEEVSKESGVSYLPTREELDRLDKPTQDKASLDEVKENAEELNIENNLDNSEINSTFVTNPMDFLYKNPNIKEILTNAGLTEEQIQQMIEEHGEQFVADYLNKCK